MSLENFNALEKEKAQELLLHCCHSTRWVDLMLSQRPFSSLAHCLKVGEHAWHMLAEADWLEAFEAHPEIGDVSSLKEKFKATKPLASKEQEGVHSADEETLSRLFRLNKEYKMKHGFIFIVFASGKTAGRMLEILESRLSNSRERELKNAAAEQWKITKLRLEKIL